jgi:hypothetical protein
MKGVFVFKEQAYQNSQNKVHPICVHQFHFTSIFCKGIFTTYFPIFKNSRDGENTSLVLFWSLEKLGILPKVYKKYLLLFYFTNPTWLWATFGARFLYQDLIYLAMWPHLISKIIWKFPNKYEDASEHRLSCYPFLSSIQDHTPCYSSSFLFSK